MSTLTQRYVHAAVAGLPEAQRPDVVEELGASVADAVDDLVAAGATPQEAERQALADLGDPAVLAERFGGSPRHLIGSAYFGMYWQLLRTLLLVIVPIVGGATLLARGLAGAGPVDALLTSVGTMFQVGVQISFWVTVVFVFLERQHTPVHASHWTPDDLPERLERRITVTDTVVGVAWLVVLIWAMVWQRNNWLVTVNGAEVPVLNADEWMPWLLTLVAVAAASIVLEIVKYRVGCWTARLAVVNTALNAAFAGIVILLWNSGTLLTPGVADLVPGGLLNPLPWLVVLIAALDTASGWWNVLRR